jgi:hypothetical protein
VAVRQRCKSLPQPNGDPEIVKVCNLHRIEDPAQQL